MRPKERVRIDKPQGRKDGDVMVACWLGEEHIHCEACLSEPALGLLTLSTEDGHLVASWWTCGRCADHDAPIHDARGLVVSVLCDVSL